MVCMQPSELYVIGHTVLSAKQVCGLIFGFGRTGCGGEPYNPHMQWNVSFPRRSKPPLRPFVQPPVRTRRLQYSYTRTRTRICNVNVNHSSNLSG